MPRLRFFDKILRDETMKYTHEIKPYKKDRYKIVETGTPGPLERFFGVKSCATEYVGSGTVWYELPEYSSVGIWRCSIFLSLWRRYTMEVEK